MGHKSKELRARQNGNTAEVIAYADKANTRLRSRYYKFIRHGKKRNVAVAEIARELACRNESSVEMYHSHLPVKGAGTAVAAKPLTISCL